MIIFHSNTVCLAIKTSSSKVCARLSLGVCNEFSNKLFISKILNFKLYQKVIDSSYSASFTSFVLLYQLFSIKFYIRLPVTIKQEQKTKIKNYSECCETMVEQMFSGKTLIWNTFLMFSEMENISINKADSNHKDNFPFFLLY